MSAECWGCVMGLTLVGRAPASPSPLGVCVQCGVLGCSGHAARDAVSYKWKCTASVVAEVSKGAGIDREADVPDEDVVRSVSEFEQRYPTLARASAREREYFLAGGGERALSRIRRQYASEGEHEMVALAVALGAFLLREVSAERLVEASEDPGSLVLPPRVAALLHAVR
jgi:hypothetical protein